jgi:hypothetical protein
VRQQLARAGQQAHLAGAPPVGLRVRLLQLGHHGRVHRPAGLAQQAAGEQAPTHADAPVDPPDRQLDADDLQRLLPGQHVLVDAVDQGSVQVEHEHYPVAHRLPGATISDPQPHNRDRPMLDGRRQERARSSLA